jgi:hypothetical protein
MLTHAKVVVRAPNGDFPLTAVKMVVGLRKSPPTTLKIGEYAIITIFTKRIELRFKQLVKVHGFIPVS